MEKYVTQNFVVMPGSKFTFDKLPTIYIEPWGHWNVFLNVNLNLLNFKKSCNVLVSCYESNKICIIGQRMVVGCVADRLCQAPCCFSLSLTASHHFSTFLTASCCYCSLLSIIASHYFSLPLNVTYCFSLSFSSTH